MKTVVVVEDVEVADRVAIVVDVVVDVPPPLLATVVDVEDVVVVGAVVIENEVDADVAEA